MISLLLFQTLTLVGEADHCRSVTAPSSNAAEGWSGRWFLQVLNWFCCLRKRSLLLWVVPAVTSQEQSLPVQLIDSQLWKWWRVEWAWPFVRKIKTGMKCPFLNLILIYILIYILLTSLLLLGLFWSCPSSLPPKYKECRSCRNVSLVFCKRL